MVVSNQRSVEALAQTAEIIFTMAVRLSQEMGIHFDFINLGGGLGVAYHPDDQPLDLETLKTTTQAKYQDIIVSAGLPAIRIVSENGRYVLGPNGYLVTAVRSSKQTYHNYLGVDATMADLMRPGMYGAYHHISAPGKDSHEVSPQRVTGSLCENNDSFTAGKDRFLPKLEAGDLLVIHDTGAHGYSMGFNYNGKLRHAELLLRADGTVQQIRRPETLQDYFKTLDYPGLA